MTTMTAPATQASALLQAFRARDFEGMGALFADDARLRALIPPGPVQDEGPDAIAARFSMWFGWLDGFDVVESSVDEVGGRPYLRWRVEGAKDDGPTVAEQHLFLTVGDKIEQLDLVCSGYRPLSRTTS